MRDARAVIDAGMIAAAVSNETVVDGRARGVRRCVASIA